jgi:hypothetical protein
MSDLLIQTGQILQQSSELMKNPAVAGAVTGFIGWMKNIFSNNKRAKERLEMIEKMQANEETINQLKTNLDDLLYENQDLQKQLEEKLAELQKTISSAGISITKTNTVNIEGNNNSVFQDINKSTINYNNSKDK